jgi:hypothetical protein
MQLQKWNANDVPNMIIWLGIVLMITAWCKHSKSSSLYLLLAFGYWGLSMWGRGVGKGLAYFSINWALVRPLG